VDEKFYAWIKFCAQIKINRPFRVTLLLSYFISENVFSTYLKDSNGLSRLPAFLIMKIDCSYGSRLKGADVSAPIFSEGTCRKN